ncbi:MAG: zinc ribbon domain-containing protein [Williamsia sp.]|nr:zinc ribbon domain-containing protein [Williamsia sp.]
MQQRICPNCNTLVPAEATFCPGCGLAVASPGTVALPTSAPDTSTPGSNNPLGALEQTKFFRFAEVFINALENSTFFKKPLRWLYILFAVLNILVPVYVLFKFISNDMLNILGIGGMMIWLVLAFAGWMGFQLWWNRKDKIDAYYKKGDQFFAIPLFSHYIQTTGEWLGTTIAILGTGSSFVAWIFLSGERSSSIGFPLPFQQFGIAGVIISPVLGFIIILAAKVVAELYRAFSAIANNTAQMASRQ